MCPHQLLEVGLWVTVVRNLLLASTVGDRWQVSHGIAHRDGSVRCGLGAGDVGGELNTYGQGLRKNKQQNMLGTENKTVVVYGRHNHSNEHCSTSKQMFRTKNSWPQETSNEMIKMRQRLKYRYLTINPQSISKQTCCRQLKLDVSQGSSISLFQTCDA